VGPKEYEERKAEAEAKRLYIPPKLRLAMEAAVNMPGRNRRELRAKQRAVRKAAKALKRHGYNVEIESK
jgi:hypothetical protein